jgi:hypothetical protein
MVGLSVVAQPCLGTALGNDGENGHRAVTDVVKNPKLLDAESKLWFAQTPQPLDPALAGGPRSAPAPLRDRRCSPRDDISEPACKCRRKHLPALISGR